MSDEESDDDDPTLIWVIEPSWRSNELAKFLHVLDGSFKPTHRRLIRPFTNDSAVVPEQLPLNFYSPEWMSNASARAFVSKSATDPVELPII
jgi:hypothetical protein